MPGASRSRVVLLSVSVSLGAISLPACKQKKESQQDFELAKAAASQSHEDLKTQVGELQKMSSDLRARLKALPEDLPGLEKTSSKLFSVEEVLGVEGAKIQWLSGELNAALTAGRTEQIQKVSETIRGSIEGNKQIGKSVLELTHQLMPFERMAVLAASEHERPGDASKATPPANPPERGCPTDKIKFTKETGCRNDGYVEFCVPATNKKVRDAVRRIAPTASNRGEQRCDATELLFFLPVDVESGSCLARWGAMTDKAWKQVCALARVPQIHSFRNTVFE